MIGIGSMGAAFAWSTGWCERSRHSEETSSTSVGIAGHEDGPG